MMKKSNHWLWTVMILLLVALLGAGCSGDSGGPNDTDDGGEDIPSVPAQITLSAINMTVAIDGMITVTAIVTDEKGDPVDDDTLIALAMNSGTGDVAITPSSQETINGRATFVVTGEEAGTANLVAEAGAAIATVTLTVVNTAPQLTLATENDETTIQVGQTITISATVTESNGALVPDDTEITFSVSDESVGDLEAVARAVTVNAVTTDGIAEVDFTARSAGSVIVTATYGAGTGMLTITVQEQSTSPPATISLSSSAASVMVGNTTTVTATVRDSASLPVADGTAVTFEVDSDSGTINPVSALTSGGRATTTFTGAKYGQAVVTATSGSATGTTIINVTANVAYLSIATSKTSIKTDNRDSATITATALDQNRVPVEGVPITFSSTAGQISAAQIETDENGEASIILTSGAYDKQNQTVTVTANAPPSQTASIPVQLTGTTVTLAINNTSLQGLPVPTSTTLTVNVKDGGGIAIFGASVTITQSSDGSGSVLLKDAAAAGTGTTTVTGTTDVTGNFVVTITGNNSGTLPVTLTATSLGATATRAVTVTGQAFELLAKTSSVAGPNNVFAFNDLNPDTITRADVGGSFVVDGFAAGDVILVSGSASNDGIYDLAGAGAATLTLATGAALTTEAAGAVVTITKLSSEETTITADTSSLVDLWVRSPAGNNVKVSTTVGLLSVVAPTVAVSGNNTSVLTAIPDPATNIAHIRLATPTAAGVATVLAEDATNSSINDALKVAIAAPSSAATKISIQASPTVIPISTGGVVNLSTILITVRNNEDQVVSGAPIILSLINPTGGGEYISPTLVYTDTFGQAQASLYSGSLVSDSEGVTCLAEIVGTGITDDIQVVIGGNASSVAIGAPTTYSSYNQSVYKIPMTVLVADSNGNPVNGATVNLSVWPLGYYTGWTDNTVGPQYCCLNYYPNEDKDRNEILGGIEDTIDDIALLIYPGHGNGVLDPAKSTAGTVPATVVTDENGVGEFDYYWQKVYATWTRVEIKASVVVYGSETIAIMPFGPTYLENEKKFLPSSPWDFDCWDPALVLWPCP